MAPELTLLVADPNRVGNFVKYFVEEIRNQARGKPTNLPPTPPKQ
jgi:hypothetical protein